MRRVGVFVCHCGINIAQNVDVEELTKYAATLDGVVVSKSYKYMCSDVGATLIKDATTIASSLCSLMASLIRVAPTSEHIYL
jgi:heterodisulfide reductase subunit A-like polyferredoxin